jgi:hypothetical protein
VILLVAVASGALVVLALFLLARVARQLPAIARVLRLPTRPLAAIAPGPFETSAVVRADEAALVATDGTPAVALRRTLQSSAGTGKGARMLPAVTWTEVAAAHLEDGEARSAIDLEGASLVAPERSSGAFQPIATLRAELPASVVDRAPIEATHASLLEVAIADGARVLVNGEAERAGAEPGSDYRSATAVFRLRGRADTAMIVSTGSQGLFLARAVPPLVFAVAAALALVAYAVANLTLL